MRVIIYIKGRMRLQPAFALQCVRSLVRAADFLITQFAGAEQRALAHYHAHQQRARRLRQHGKARQEVAFLLNQ
jgi:hypothetical protein